MKLLVLHGPNLSRAFLRELPREQKSVEAFQEWLEEEGQKRGIQVTFRRFPGEGELCEAMEAADGNYDAVIINVGLLRYTSLALWGAIRGCPLPCIEVIPLRERLPMERSSLTGRACLGAIRGLGLFSYLAAMDFLKARDEQGNKPVVTRPSAR